MVGNHQLQGFDDAARSVDVVIDTIGGDARDRSLQLLRPGGILVSVISAEAMPQRSDVRSVFFYVEVTTERLNAISELFDREELSPQVGTVLPLQEVRAAHQMLAGAPHKRGKIVLQVTP